MLPRSLHRWVVQFSEACTFRDHLNCVAEQFSLWHEITVYSLWTYRKEYILAAGKKKQWSWALMVVAKIQKYNPCLHKPSDSVPREQKLRVRGAIPLLCPSFFTLMLYCSALAQLSADIQTNFEIMEPGVQIFRAYLSLRLTWSSHLWMWASTTSCWVCFQVMVLSDWKFYYHTMHSCFEKKNKKKKPGEAWRGLWLLGLWQKRVSERTPDLGQSEYVKQQLAFWPQLQNLGSWVRVGLRWFGL